MKRFIVAVVGVLALGGCAGGDSAEPAASPVGAVTVENPYIMPNGEVAGMFGEVTNATGQAVRLTGGAVPGVEMVQIHEYVTEGTKETMKEVEGGLEIPAGQTVMLEPGSYHAMLMGVTADWKVGDVVPVVLNLSDGSTVSVDAAVMARPGTDAGMEME